MWNPSCQQKSTFFLLTISFLITVAVGREESNGILNIYPNQPLHTEAYQQAARYLEASIDTSVNPCDDFYQYSCGRFNASSSWFDETNEKVINEVVDAFKTSNDKDPLPVKQVKRMYTQCLKDSYDWDNAVKNGTILKELVLDYMTTTNLPFPLLEANSNDQTWPDRTNISRALGYLFGQYGENTFLSMMFSPNFEDPTSSNAWFLELEMPALFHYNGFYFEYRGDNWNATRKEIIADVRKNFESYAALTGLIIDQNDIISAGEEIADLEWYIVNNLVDVDPLATNLIRFDNLKKKYAGFDFETFIQYATVHADKKVYKKISKRNYRYNLAYPAAFQQLSDMFENNFYGKFKGSVFKNYMYYRLIKNNHKLFPSWVSSSQPDRNNRKQNIVKFPKQKPSGVKTRQDPLEMDIDKLPLKCYYSASDLKYAHGRVFIDKILPKQSDRESYYDSLKYIIDNVLVGMESMIDGLSWMKPETKQMAYKKIKNLIRNYVYPEWIMDDGSLTEYYSGLSPKILDANFPEIEIYYEKFMIKKDFDLLLADKIDRYDWGELFLITDINAWYAPDLNSITIPAGILQGPTFNPDYPTSINFGGIGTVAGHELTHGFDSMGVHWGPLGEMMDWLDSETAKHFDEMAECVIEEYNQYCPLNSSFTHHCVNGSNTQGENIADNGGIHAAYRAYRNIIDFKGPDPLLPGEIASRFTHDQLFFLSFAQVWCEPPGSPFNPWDPHSPAKYRVLGTIRNFPAFRSAFNCPIGSNSAPKDHCNVWISDVNIPKTPESYEVLNIPDPHLIKPDDKYYTKYSQAQAFFQASMNLSADPCNNFYEYACGAYNQSLISFYEVGQRNVKTLAAKLDNMLQNNDEEMLKSSAINKTMTFYSKCTSFNTALRSKTYDTSKEGNLAADALTKFEQLFGYEFNFCDLTSENTNNDPKNLAKALAYLKVNYDIDSLVSTFVYANAKRDPVFASNHSLYLDQSTLTYDNTYYQPEVWKKYTYDTLKQNLLQLFKDYTKSVKMDCKIGVLEYHIENLLEFEYLLANNFSASDDLRRNFSGLVNPRKIREIPYNFLDWATFVMQISNDSGANFVDASEINDYYVMMTEPNAMKGFNEYFDNIGIEPIVKYLFYRLLSTQQDYIIPKSDNYIQMYDQQSFNFGLKQRPEDPFVSSFDGKDNVSIKCAWDVMSYFPLAGGRIFVEALYPTPGARKILKADSLKVIASLQSSMQSMIEDLPWISGEDETLKSARDKVQNMQINAAFPDSIFDNDKLDAMYANINLDPNANLADMYKILNTYKMRKSYETLLPGTDIDRTVFAFSTIVVNAAYDATRNSISIPAGILQQPFYDPEWPASIKFGAGGVVMGHEITHGFDDQGIQWNGEGILDDWMTENSQQAFDAMAQCVIDEYDNFTVIQDQKYSPRNLNGRNTQGENIADNGGIHSAYTSYRRWISLNGPDPQLPDRIFGQLTHDQLFFLSFAQVWCERPPTDAAIYKQILVDPHSPSKSRVFGTLQNFPAFRDAFNCPANSAYTPQKHCSVWVPKN